MRVRCKINEFIVYMKKNLHIEDVTSINFVALGDSLTDGWMERHGYMEWLQRLLSEQFQDVEINCQALGIPGDPSSGGLRRLSQALSGKPDVLILQFGLNDALMGYPPHSLYDNYRKMIDITRKDTPGVLPVAISSVFIPSSEIYNVALDFYQRIQQAAADEDVPYIPVHEYMAQEIGSGPWSRLYQYDGLHPTLEGYRVMALALLKGLLPLLVR